VGGAGRGALRPLRAAGEAEARGELKWGAHVSKTPPPCVHASPGAMASIDKTDTAPNIMY
jgi:hypothetical protein